MQQCGRQIMVFIICVQFQTTGIVNGIQVVGPYTQCSSMRRQTKEIVIIRVANTGWIGSYQGATTGLGLGLGFLGRLGFFSVVDYRGRHVGNKIRHVGIQTKKRVEDRAPNQEHPNQFGNDESHCGGGASSGITATVSETVFHHQSSIRVSYWRLLYSSSWYCCRAAKGKKK